MAEPLKICEFCGHPHLMEAITCALALKAAISNLLTNVGAPAKCKGCHAEIFWVTHRNGKRTPYTPEGLNHFITCPNAPEFRGARDA